jgi:hypothetical protein
MLEEMNERKDKERKDRDERKKIVKISYETVQ